jgi:tetratricopeptide (TPR) repeat protein
MDCRHTFLLGLALTTGVAGCLPQSMMVPDEPEKKKEVEVVKHPPKNASTCVAMGNQQADQAEMEPAGSAAAEGYSERARLAYQQAIQIDPKHIPAYHALARLYLALGDVDQATRTYTEALKLCPKDSSLWFELGWKCYARARNFDRALDALHRACELEPNNRFYAEISGQCLAAAGRYDEAVRVLNKYMGEAKAHYDVARMAEHNHQDGIARQHLQAALNAEPTNPGALEMLARLNGDTSGLTPPGYEPKN